MDIYKFIQGLKLEHIVPLAIAMAPIVLPYLLPQTKDTPSNIVVNNYYLPMYQYRPLLVNSPYNRISYI